METPGGEGGQQWRPSSYAAADRSRLRHGEGLLSRLHLLLPPPDFPPPRKGETSEGWEDPSSPSELPIHFASHRSARLGEHIGAARRQRHATFSFWATRRCKGHSQEKKSRGATQLIGPSAPTRRSCVDSLMTSQHSITIAAPHRWADRMLRSGLSLSGGSAARRDSGGAEFGGGASSEVGAVLLIRPRHGERVQQCTVQNVVPGSAAMRCLPTSSPHHPRLKFLGHSPRLHGRRIQSPAPQLSVLPRCPPLKYFDRCRFRCVIEIKEVPIANR